MLANAAEAVELEQQVRDAAEREEANRGWRALMLSTSLEVTQALFAGEAVPIDQLDPGWVQRFGLRDGLVTDRRRVRLDDFNTIPSAAPEETGSPDRAAEGESGELRIVSAYDFADVDEPGAAPLLGDLIGEGDKVMLYGDGGVGKTTLSNDLACHLAAGDDWHGIPVPRPVRTLLIEAEGSRPRFRIKLRRKLAAWQGSPIDDRLHVWEEPWAALSFTDEHWCQRLAAAIREYAIDVLVVGPLTGVGMDAPGTIAEARAFVDLVDAVVRRSGRPTAVLLVHHENRAGKVSGAWEGAVDTLLHATQQGHGRLRLYIQKARWASELHATTLQLTWADGDSFAVDETPVIDDDAVAGLIVAAIASDPGKGWTRVEKATRGVADGRRRQVRDRLLRDAVIANVVKNENGVEVVLDYCPERRQARLYPADDPSIRHLRRESAADAPQTAALWGDGATAALRRAAGSIEPHAVAPQFHTPSDLDPAEVERLADRLREDGA